jgi:D-3-phosphoglycerate dehydrogenase
VGSVGSILGSAGINIAGMQVARQEAGGEALMAINVDSAISTEIISVVEKETGAHVVRTVSLVG